MTVDMSPSAISARLEEVSRQADLDPKRRLDSKIQYSGSDISRRLREVDALRDVCDMLGRAVPSNGQDP
jgi:hypothetical protein